MRESRPSIDSPAYFFERKNIILYFCTHYITKSLQLWTSIDVNSCAGWALPRVRRQHWRHWSRSAPWLARPAVNNKLARCPSQPVCRLRGLPVQVPATDTHPQPDESHRPAPAQVLTTFLRNRRQERQEGQ